MAVDFTGLNNAVIDAFGTPITLRLRSMQSKNLRHGTSTRTTADIPISANIGPSRIAQSMDGSANVEEVVFSIRVADAANQIDLNEQAQVRIPGRDADDAWRDVVEVNLQVNGTMAELVTRRKL